MTIPQVPTEHQTQSLHKRIFLFGNLLIAPHPSVQDSGEKRRAQLLAILSLILTVSFILTLLFSPTKLYGVFVVYLSITAISYALSRTKYYRFGTYIFTCESTSVAYIRLYNRSTNGVDASILTIATFAVPPYSQIPLASGESLARIRNGAGG